MNTFAILMGKTKLLEVTSKHSDILFGFKGKSLIELCKDLNDTDSWPIIMEKSIQNNSFMNLETLQLLLGHDDQTSIFDYLKNHQIKDAEYNNLAYNMLPIMGEIKKSYLFSEEKLINPEMIEEAVDLKIDVEKR